MVSEEGVDILSVVSQDSSNEQRIRWYDLAAKKEKSEWSTQIGPMHTWAWVWRKGGGKMAFFEGGFPTPCLERGVIGGDFASKGG